jgi:hypothetical protein
MLVCLCLCDVRHSVGGQALTLALALAQCIPTQRTKPPPHPSLNPSIPTPHPTPPHDRTGRASKCFRVNYRSMERSLTNEEVDVLQDEVRSQIADQLKVELR